MSVRKGCLALLPSLWAVVALADAPRIVEVRVAGQHAVQAEAITGIMASRKGGLLSPTDVRNDIKAIFKTGFFRDVRIDREDAQGGVSLVVTVVEKPIISAIRFEGFREVSTSSLDDKLQTKRYTIVDEKRLQADVRTIEQMYIEKSYYLARVSYELRASSSGEATLVFLVEENNPVQVGRVSILGNVRFSDAELRAGMLTAEKRWGSWLNSTGVFRDEFVGRDKEYISYLYKDNGYIEADVATPQARLSLSRQRVDISYSVEEGEKFDVGKIRFSGDIIFPESLIREKLALHEGKLFRVSQFQADVRTLTDLYGDEGYAFVDVVPRTTTHRDKRLVDLEWEIHKGEKAYFRKIVIEGNTKSRDNVIRRNLRVAEGERFHATNLEKSREAIDRLGFFQEVVVQKEPDAKNNVVDLRVKVKEKQTGSLNASIGASPSQQGQVNFMAQGAYNESNFLGKGWETAFSGNVSKNDEATSPNWGLSLSFTEPSIFDGPWSSTVYGKFDYEYTRPISDEPERASRRTQGGISLGREILEDLRLSVGYSYERVDTDRVDPVFEFMTERGDTERLTETLSFNRTNNFRMPTAGYFLSATTKQAVHLFGGDHWFSKLDLSAVYYVPVPFTDDYLTNFRFAFEPGWIYPLGGRKVPVWERLKLGNPYNMRAFQSNPITPRREMLDWPGADTTLSVAVGGVARYYGSAEYFLPLIPEANLRLVTFGEAGTVLDDKEPFAASKLKYDVGIGLRWLTPIAPFRFEWAWPVNRGKLGEGDFVFTIGNDNAAAF